MLVFVATSKTTHAFLLNGEGRYTLWQLDRCGAASLAAAGHRHAARDRQLPVQSRGHSQGPGDSKWQQAGPDLLDTILKGSRADFAKKFDELIVVPDGVLWYVPFEALQVKSTGNCVR